MHARGSSCRSHNVRKGLLELIKQYRLRSHNVSLGYGSCSSSSSVVANKIGHVCSTNHGFQMFSSIGASWKNPDPNRLKTIKDGMRPPVHNPPSFNFSTWAKWVLGSVLSLLLPFWKQKWEKLKMIEGQADIVIEEAETVATVVEKVATMAEKYSAEVAEKLPDNGKLKKAALQVEHISKTTAQDAHLTKDIIHQVEKLKHDFDDLETMVEPAIEKLIQHKPQVK